MVSIGTAVEAPEAPKQELSGLSVRVVKGGYVVTAQFYNDHNPYGHEEERIVTSKAKLIKAIKALTRDVING